MAVPSQKPSRFLSKLRELLSRPDDYGHCIRWVHDGQAIEILDEKEFANSVLLETFLYSNFNSFIRQLNVYGFRKTRRNLNERVYYHPQFIQHRPELAKMIKRKCRRKRYQSNLPDTQNTVPKPSMQQRLPSIHQLLSNLRSRSPKNRFVCPNPNGA